MKRWLWSGLLATSLLGFLGCADSDRHGAAPTLASITVDPVSATISVQRPQQYKATGAYSDNSTADITPEVAWTSSNQAVATIDAGGKASGAAEGVTTIKASLSSIEGSSALTVSSVKVTPRQQTISPGEAVQFTAAETFAPDPAKQDITAQVTWSSSDTSIVTIDKSGLATGIVLHDDPILITAKASDGRTGYAVLKIAEAGPSNRLPVEIVCLVNNSSRAYAVDYDLWAFGIKTSLWGICTPAGGSFCDGGLVGASVGEIRVHKQETANCPPFSYKLTNTRVFTPEGTWYPWRGFKVITYNYGIYLEEF